MPLLNYANREIQFKIVYYGPALAGKTANLTYIHSRIGQAYRGDLVSLATSADRTLFFDLLPLHAEILQGFKTKFQLFTVDGVVFVADSQWDKMEENVHSFRNLEENLRTQGISLDEFPYVLEFNKRDLQDIAPANYLEYLLNNRKRRVQSFESMAKTGENVFAALDAVTQLLLRKFDSEHRKLHPSARG
jgi:signal recognition particle receptor subunit beta